MDTFITRRRRQELMVAGGLLVVAIVAPLFIKDVTALNVIILSLLFAGLSQAWNILGGYCGQISLGHALYFGMGSYVSTLLYVHGAIPPSIGMFAGAAVGGLAALLVGWPCFRLSGHYYAIATVVVGEIGYLLFLNWDYVGGATGVYIPIARPSLVNLQFGKDKLPYLYVVLAFCAATWLAAWLIEGSRWGYAWRAVKDDMVAARSLGVNIFSSKMAAAAISGAFTGLGGAIYGLYVGYIDPDSVMAGHFSILIALPAVLGGVGTLWGPILGAALLIPMKELSSSYLGGSGRGVDLMLYGAMIVVVALVQPQGVVSLFRRRAHGPA